MRVDSCHKTKQVIKNLGGGGREMGRRELEAGGVGGGGWGELEAGVVVVGGGGA